MRSVLLLGALLCAHLTTAALYKEDTDLAKKVRESLSSDKFVFSITNIKLGKSHKPGIESLFHIEFPGSDNDFHLKLDRLKKRIYIETKQNGQSITEGWSLKPEILELPTSIINTLNIEVTQDIMGARYRMNCECLDHGTLAMTMSLKKMLDAAKKPRLKLYREYHFQIAVYKDSTLSKVLDSDSFCNPGNLWNTGVQADDPRDLRRLRDNDLDPRYQTRDLIPSGRSDIPINHDCDDNLLIKTVNELTSLVKRLQQELEAQRAETRALRDYIERCNICRPGED